MDRNTNPIRPPPTLLGRKLTLWGFQNGTTLENWSIGSKVRYFWKIKKNQIYLKKIAFQFWSGSNMKRNYFWGGSCVKKTGAAWAPTFIVLFWKWICSLRRLLPTPFTGSPRETGLGESAGQDRQGWRTEELWHFCGRPSSVLWPGWCHQKNWVQRMGSRCTGWRGRSEQILQGRGSWVGQEHRQWRPQHTGECGEHRRHETNKI